MIPVLVLSSLTLLLFEEEYAQREVVIFHALARVIASEKYIVTRLATSDCKDAAPTAAERKRISNF